MAARVCLARLVFLLFLLVPLTLTQMAAPEKQLFWNFTPVHSYQLFLIAGFSLTICFLILGNRFAGHIAFYWLQLAADLILACFLILITGALGSNFAFIGLALLFLYGRTLGMSAANILAACLAAFYLALAVLQAARILQPLALQEAALYASLHFLAVGLMLLLVRTNAGHMQSLLQEMLKRETQLRHSESIKRKVLDWMPSGLVVLNQQGRIATINPQALAWAGMDSLQQAISQPLDALYPNLHSLWTTWDQKTSLRSEFTHHDRLFGATLTKLPEGLGTLILFTDITRIKELEHQVREMEKMATLGELAAGLAHEIKNPLSGIQASVQLLPSSSLPEDKRQRLYSVIQNDIRRLNHLLTNFLAFARPREAKRQHVSLDHTVRSCLFTLQSEFAQVDFRIQDELGDRYWTWDPDQLHQVLLNLLMNAAQAAAGAEHPQVTVSWGVSADTEYIAVTDNGLGLDPRITGRIFDPFVTTKAKGSGLGLAIAQRLAHQNRARIEIVQDQAPSRGVTARIVTGYTAQPAADQDPGSSTPRKGAST